MSSGAIYTLKRKRSHSLEAVKETIRGVSRWKIRGLYRGGKRVRKFFPTEQKALEFVADELAKVRNLGDRARNIPGHLHEDALRAFDLLQGHGVTLEEVAKFYRAAMDRRQKSKPVREVTEEYIKDRDVNLRSVRHIEDLKSRLGRFNEDFGDTLTSEITTRELAQWLANLKPARKGAKYSPLSTINFHRVVRAFFTYAVAMGYANENPAKKVTTPKMKESAPSIFTPTQVATILQAAGEEILPFFALGAFAGLRSSEIQRLTWEEIDFSRNMILPPAEKTKSAKRRIVPLLPNLREFLLPYADRKGKILPFSRRHMYDLAAPALRIAGFGRPGTETEGEKAARVELTTAPGNGLRHSFASYRLASTNDAAKTALELGHPNTKLLFSTYRELVAPEDAETYWSIAPEPAKPGVIVPGEFRKTA